MNQHHSSQFDSWIGRLIGDRYQLEQRLGGGGMGDVFLATDTRLGKSVALKVFKESLAFSQYEDLKARFERECAICAALRSTHIVQVSDYGLTTEGYPFYVMEYLQGQTLGQRLSQQPQLSIAQTCNMIAQVCEGLSAAHAGVTVWNRETNTKEQIKVVHRDLKPDNIFLIPSGLGEFVKVIDFGIAKIQSLQAEYATTSVFLGTCHYASPEQFDAGTVDERSDIYSLGIILYEMLAGVDPFGLDFRKNRVTNNAWLAAHAIKQPNPLRSQPGCEQIPPELEAIVMRCLQKSPADRFSSVQELGAALQTVALPINDWSVAKPEIDSSTAKTEIRSRVSSPQAASTESTLSTKALSTKASSITAKSFQFKRLIGAGGILLALAIGVYTVPKVLTQTNLLTRSIGIHPFQLSTTLSGSSSAVLAAISSADGRLMISAVDDRDPRGHHPIQVWDVDRQQMQRNFSGHSGVVRSLSLDANETVLASGSDDRTIKLWNVETGTLIQTLEGHSAPVLSVALSPDGTTVISGSEDRTVRIWDLKTGNARVLSAHLGAVQSVALSPDGKTIASSSADKTIRIWDRVRGELVRTLGEPGGHRDTVNSVAFSSDGQQLVSGGSDGFVKLWNPLTGQLLQVFEGHSDRVTSVAFLTSETIATAGFDQTIKIWQTKTGELLQSIAAHSDQVSSINALPDQTLVSSSRDTTIRIWRR
jgi:WD40 repeat protein